MTLNSDINDSPEPDMEGLRQRVIEALQTIYDPEIPVNIYELGLVYEIELDRQGRALIRMTLTTPGCPVAQSFPMEVESRVKAVEGVSDAAVELVWDPPWDPSRMSEAARLELGFF